MTTLEAKTSIMELSPKATNASDPAATPRPMVTNTSMRFHPVVAHSRRMPRRCKRSWSAWVIVIGSFRSAGPKDAGMATFDQADRGLGRRSCPPGEPGPLTGDQWVPACR